MKKGELLAVAIRLAVTAHVGQFDRGGSPYILHPLKVMHYTKSEDEEVLCIAVLHDAVEDSSLTYREMLDAGLTERIVQGVAALTKVPGEGYDDYKVRVMQNKDAVKVKMADLRHNTDIRRLKGVTEKDIARMAKYHQFFMELKAIVE